MVIWILELRTRDSLPLLEGLSPTFGHKLEWPLPWWDKMTPLRPNGAFVGVGNGSGWIGLAKTGVRQKEQASGFKAQADGYAQALVVGISKGRVGLDRGRLRFFSEGLSILHVTVTC